MNRELTSLSYRLISIWIQVLILIKNRAILVIILFLFLFFFTSPCMYSHVMGFYVPIYYWDFFMCENRVGHSFFAKDI